MSRESSFSSAGRACAQVETAVEKLEEAVRRLDQYTNTLEFYWTGEAGTAMSNGVASWRNQAETLVQRISQLASQMRASQSCDYSLWPEEEC